MRIEPIDDRVVLRIVKPPNKSKGGIVLPDSAAEGEARKAGLRGTVVAAGPGRLLDSGERVPMQVREHDRVLFPAYAGAEVEIDGEPFVILKEQDLLGIERT